MQDGKQLLSIPSIAARQFTEPAFLIHIHRLMLSQPAMQRGGSASDA